jgi:uncharacterized protein (UPF0371 family)
VTGRNSKLLHAASSCILNAVKLLANLPDNLTLLSPEVIKAVASLKQDVYHNKGISLDLSETLTALSVSSPSNPAAKLALDELKKLKGCEMHLSHIPPAGDENALRKLAINVTSEPRFIGRNLLQD